MGSRGICQYYRTLTERHAHNFNLINNTISEPVLIALSPAPEHTRALFSSITWVYVHVDLSSICSSSVHKQLVRYLIVNFWSNGDEADKSTNFFLMHPVVLSFDFRVGAARGCEWNAHFLRLWATVCSLIIHELS